MTHDFRYPLGHFVTARYWQGVDPEGIHFTLSDTGWGKALWGKLYGQRICEAAVFVYDMTGLKIMEGAGNYSEVLYDGLYHTGDLARESVIMELPFVLECGVIGVPDPQKGQRIISEVMLHCKKRMAN